MASQLNLANALTLFRIFLVPILVVVILTRFEGKEIVGVTIFLVAAATDALDGYVARKRRQITTLGKLLDPMADKLLVSGAFISLIDLGVAPAWMVATIIGREFAVTGLRGIAAERGVTIDASFFGKIKMGVQVACIVALLLSKPHVGEGDVVALVASPFGKALLWVTVFVTVASGVEYFVRFWKLLDTERP